MWGVDVTPPAADVIAKAREGGLLLVGAGEHTIRFLPPLIVTPAQISHAMKVFEEALAGA
jgi:acetylornithine/succinyldiaminopimelate/putrescine aminotransferase